MQGAGASAGALNGARAAYELHAQSSQEDYAKGKSASTTRNRNYSNPRQPLSAVANRSGNKEGLQPAQPAYNRVEDLGKLDGGVSRSGSEGDSLFDLYRRNNSNNNLTAADQDNDIPENMYRPEDDDPEGWIHRDKLAKIENEELQAAGINLANAKRTYSRTSKKALSRDGSSDSREQSLKPGRDEKRQRISSPVAEEDEEKERTRWDLRSPEEIAESGPTNPVYNPVLRKTGSKIPILTSSPLPIPQERVERDTPLPRTRTLSGSISPEDSLPGGRIRPRGNSSGSQNLLDDAVAVNGTPTPATGSRSVSKTSSPTKSKTTDTPSSPSSPPGGASRKTTPSTRKPSIPKKVVVPTPAPTSPSASQRPPTRSGEGDRPRTAVNRPESDPPWLATMYKSDPRLPPDEQIIPTHARRQQQAQWNEEGAIPITYDREFSPLSVHPPSDDPSASASGPVLQPSPSLPEQTHGPGRSKADAGAWPLKPLPPIRHSNSANGRPGTSGSITAGYSTMPKVTSPLISSVQSPLMQMTPTRMQETKLADLENQKDEKRKERGCGCCVVM